MGKLDDILNQTKEIEVIYFDENNETILAGRFYFRKEIKILQELTAFILLNQDAPKLLKKLEETNKEVK